MECVSSWEDEKKAFSLALPGGGGDDDDDERENVLLLFFWLNLI